MAQKINLNELLSDVTAYEPTLLRVPMETTELLPEEQLRAATVKTAQDILKRSGVKQQWLKSADDEEAQDVFMDHVALNPKAQTNTQALKPAAILKLEALLNEYDWNIVQHADQIRTLVTNKLIELSDHREARVQLKAIELLGKLADVGMFVDKQEITYKHQSGDELQKKLQDKLGILIQGEVTARGIEDVG